MNQKGQIVEVPATSIFYRRLQPDFISKRQELLWKSEERRYTLFDGFLVGEHSGLNHFKLGQRKGIKVGGKKEPLYVIHIDKENNRLFVGAGENHPGLWSSVLFFPRDVLRWAKQNAFSPNEQENGISIEIASSLLEQILPAKLYVFNSQVFLEFGQETLKAIKENPLRIFYHNTIIAENNK